MRTPRAGGAADARTLGMALRWIVILVLVVVASVGVGVPPVAAASRCSNGNIALTFDDGPRIPYTTRILDTLRAKRAPATFFVVGQVADGQPGLLKRMHREGHVIANHSWSHPPLSSLSDAGIRWQLDRTNREIASHGVAAPRIMRPPYGATSNRVRSVVAGMGMAHVLWTVDTSDWRPGRSSSSIAGAALSQLHGGANILMHDGVGNSGATAAALPRIIDGARARGYCVGTLDSRGRVVPATPAVRIANARVREADPGRTTRLSFRVSLSVPTSRTVKIPWTTVAGTARPDRDYRPRSGTLVFAPGTTTATITVPVIGDRLDEHTERLKVRLGRPAAATLARVGARGLIVDDDAAPSLRVADAKVVETSSPGKVRVTLNRPSGKWVTASYGTIDRTAKAGVHYRTTRGQLVFRPGQTAKVVAVPIIDRKGMVEGTVAFELSVHSPTNAGIARRSGVVSITDDPMPTLSTADVSEIESAHSAVVTVMLSRATTRTVTVGFTTADVTAYSGTDYAATSGTLTFRSGETSKHIAVPLIDDEEHVGGQQFAVGLARVDGTALNAVLAKSTATVTIADDDPAPEAVE